MIEIKATLERLLAPVATKTGVATVVGGAFIGYAIQQARQTLDQIPHDGILPAPVGVAAMANGGMLTVKDIGAALTGKAPGASLETDGKYAAIFNAALLAGYVAGHVKDVLVR